jgi:hypothetical protein
MWAKKLIEKKPFKLVAVALPTKWRASPSRSWVAVSITAAGHSA